MNSSPLSLEEAEQRVKESTRQVEVALDHLKEKVDSGFDTFQKFMEAAKQPRSLLGITFVVGIFFGQLIRYSYQQEIEESRHKPSPSGS